MYLRFLIACAISILLCACVSRLPHNLADAATVPASLPAPVQDMMRLNQIPVDALAAIAIRLSDGATVMSHQPDKIMQPASTMKMVTTIVGLERLGPTMRWRTELRTSAAIDNGVLQGDLILRGGGDGNLTWEIFQRMLQSLRSKGIRDIRGDLVLDRQLFQPPRSDVGVPPFDEAPSAEYNVIPDALLINTNLLKLEFEADSQIVRVTMTPELERVTIEPQLSLTDGKCSDWDEDELQFDLKMKPEDGSIGIQLVGAFPRNCAHSIGANILERDIFIDRLFRSLWSKLGGTFLGTTREGVMPADSKLLTSQRSRTLADVIRDINKPSDNALSRLLYLSLGTTENRTDGNSFENAQKQVRSWFGKLGINVEGLVLENGSGLSRQERIRPSQLAALLVAAYRSNWAPEFLSSLPIVGLDGTMRNRLRESPVAGRARMKTGTMNNVVAVAGYVPDASGQMHVLVVMLNHRPADGKLLPLGRPVVDAIVDWLGRSGAK